MTKSETAKKKRKTTPKLKKTPLQIKAEEIMKQAEKKGLTQNFFFVSTFNRYLVQLEILDNLEIEIKAHGATVTKEYVKGRENLVANPAITEYNKTSTAANGTVATLIKILDSVKTEDDGEDSLSAFING